MPLPTEIRRILKELVPHKKRLSIVAGSGLLMAAADTTNANLVKYVFDGFNDGSTEQIKRVFIWIIVLAFFRSVFRYYHIYNMNVTSELVTQSLRQQLQFKFMRLNLAFHNSYASGSGGLISRALYDISVIFHGLRMYADFFREPALFLGLIGTLFYLNWQLTMSIIVVLPLILIFLRQISKSIKKYSIRAQEDIERVTTTIKESLDGVRIIQSFNLENELARRFRQDSQNFLDSRRRFHSLVEGSGPTTEFVMTLLIFSIMMYMAMDISAGRSTIGDFMSYVVCLLMLSPPVKKAQESYVRIQETSVAAERVFSLLDSTDEVPESLHPQAFPHDWKQIRFVNVSFKYSDQLVLRNINLTINRGELVAFVGASGCGKSTLVNLLERFFDPTEGTIFLDDTPLTAVSLKALRDNVALVSQDVFLFADTIEFNIGAGNFNKTPEDIRAAARRANAEPFIQRLPQGYASRVGDKGNLLSGGEKQRISIARAFLKDAPILVLDEATSSLDTGSEIEVQRGLDQLMEGRTALVVAHRFSTIARADRIYVMKSGQIVESGTHDELLNLKREYFRLHFLQKNGDVSIS